MITFIWSDGRSREPLPVDSHLEKLEQLLQTNQAVVADAEGGAGKTTRFCQALVLSDPNLHVWLTQPRRNAVRWNGKRIAQELGCEPGQLVGWRLRGELPMESLETRLHMRVDRSLINAIIHSNGHLPEGIIIVDEAHERSVNADMLLGLIVEALPYSPRTKLLVTSATIDTQKFSAFAGGAPVLSIKGRNYPVRTEVLQLGYGEHHTEGAARAAGNVLDQFLRGELTVPSGGNDQVVSKGTCLVLLPGTEDIAEVISSLRKAAEERRALGRVEILPCHGDSTPEEQDRVQSPLRDNTLRFVCGTEILRSSVTVVDTVGVIDSLQIKRNLTDEYGVNHLTKIAVSQAEANQARYRAGRTGPGFYIAVSFGDEYFHLEPYPQPAVLREPITSVALQVASIDRSIWDFPWIDHPDPERIEVAVRRLKQVGAFNADEKITPVGEFLASLSVDPEDGKALLTSSRLGVLPETAICVAARMASGIFQLPRKEGDVVVDEKAAQIVLANFGKDEDSYWKRLPTPRRPEDVGLDPTDLPRWVTYTGAEGFTIKTGIGSPLRNPREVAAIMRRYWAGESCSDFVAVVRAVRACEAERYRLRHAVERDGQPLSAKDQNVLHRKWCTSRFLNRRRIRLACEYLVQIKQDLEGTGLHLKEGALFDRIFDYEALTKSLLSGLIDNVGVRVASYGLRQSHAFNSPLGRIVASHTSACSYNELMGTSTNLVLVDSVTRVHSRSGFTETLLADLLAPVRPEWLMEILPQLCRSEQLDDEYYDPKQDEVVATEMVYVAQTLINERQVRATDDEAAATCFAQWLAEQECEPVLPANKAQQDRARFLNVRAGRTVLRVWEKEELAEFLRERLAGARSIKDVRDPEALKLPAPDEQAVGTARQSGPDQIMLAGQSRTVHYHLGLAPSVVIPLDDLTVQQLQELPDDGVRLPGGFTVVVSIKVNDEIMVEDSNIPSLKQKVKETLRNALFKAWRDSGNRPVPGATEMPDPANPESYIPEIVEEVYGTCPITGEPLVAYGTYGLARTSEGPFSFFWYPDRKYAELQQGTARGMLKGLRAQLKNDEELAKLLPEVRQLKELLAELLQNYRQELPEGLQNQLSSALASDIDRRPSVGADDMQYWLDGAWELATTAEAVGSEEQRLNRKNLLRDFGGPVRLILTGNQGCNDFFVIDSNGLPREPDESVLKRGNEGRKSWRRILPDELVLSWRLTSRAGSHNFDVHYPPEAGCTPEQLAAVRRLEEEIWNRWEGSNSTMPPDWGWTAKLAR